MDTVSLIRRVNLQLLLDEITVERGNERGSQAELSARSRVPAAYISQLKRDVAHSGGARRTIGDDIARKLELGMNKPPGWMDHPHDSVKDIGELDFLRLFRRLSAAQREHLKQSAELFLANAPSEADANRDVQRVANRMDH